MAADALRRRLESLRFRGKWADVKGVAEDNDAIMAGGGFDLASDGDMMRVSVPALPAAESFQLSSRLARIAVGRGRERANPDGATRGKIH